MAKKSQPLSLEDLLDAQKSLLTASNLTEDQRKRAEDQIAKLEALRESTEENTNKQTEVANQVKIMTKPKGNSNNVTLGDVRNELKGVRQDLKTFAGTDPNPNRKPLARGKRNDIIDVDAREVPGISKTKQRAEREERLSSIGSTLGEKAELYQKGAGKEVTTAKNAETFQRFVAETKKKDELLKDATDDQIKLFDRLEDTLIKLRDSDAKDSAELRKELAKIAGELETTSDTEAKKSIGGVLENTRNRARSGARGDSGTLGDAWSALTGKQKVLKEGYEFDPRMGENAVRRTKDNELGKAGRLAQKGEVVSMGRIAGAAKIAGNFFRGKVEDYNAKNASNLGSDFLDRTFGGNRLGEDRARLGARAEALIQGRDQKGGGAKGGKAMPIPTARTSASGAMNITATVVNLRGPIKMSVSGSGSNAGNAAALAGKDWPPKSTATPITPMAAAAPAQAAAEQSGMGLGDAAGLAGIGSAAKSAGGAILNAGKSFITSPVGATVAAGAAMYGAGRLVDWGAGKLGVGKDEKGNDLQLDTKADDANWNRMSWFEKAQSGVARGIEKVGGFVAPNMANQAAADRIKKESEYFANQDRASVAPTTPKVQTKTMKASDQDAAMFDLAYSSYRSDGMSVKDAREAAANDVKIRKQAQAENVAGDTAETKLVKPSSTILPATEPKQQYLQKVGSLSNSNAAAKEASNKPVVIQQPAAPAPAAPAPAPNIMMPRGQVRSTESAMDRYSNRNAHYF